MCARGRVVGARCSFGNCKVLQQATQSVNENTEEETKADATENGGNGRIGYIR